MRTMNVTSRALLAASTASLLATSTAYAAEPLPLPLTARFVSTSTGPAVVLKTETAVVAPAPVVALAVQTEAPVKAELPAESSLAMTPTAEVSTKKLKAGDRVDLVTVGDVMHNGVVVIPAGSIGYATVVEAAGRAAFGRGGQMKMKFEEVRLADGRVIGLTGVHTETGARQDTQTAANLGQTGAALAGSFGAVGALVGLFSRAAITGRSAVIKPGAKLKAFTAQTVYYGPAGAGEVAAKQEPAVAAQPAAITLPGAAISGTFK